MSEPAAALRIDKWLWHARFFKTRSLATRLVAAGHVRLNGDRVTKASALVRPGDGLTFPQGRQIRVVRIEALGHRRGPAPEAAALYTDLDPPGAKAPPPPRVGARPTKKARRSLDLARDGDPHPDC